MNNASLDAQTALLSTLADATRLRLCALLSQHELSVGELTHVLELGQSKVSTHLARLKDHELVFDRRVSTSSYYRFNEAGLSGPARNVWEALKANLDDALLERDLSRAKELIAARKSDAWPERFAGELERHYSPGRTWESLSRSFAGLVRADRVLDIGAGDGTVADMLCARTQRYVCLDLSARLLAAARSRLRAHRNVTLVQGDMHALPFESGSFDLVLSLHVLALGVDPMKALDEAARVVRPRGELLVVTLKAHDQLDTTAPYGHRHPGFEPRALRRRLTHRSMRVLACDVIAREPRRPHFEVLRCLAQKE